MIPLILTVLEFSKADTYGIVRFQLSSPDKNFYAADVISITTTIEFLESIKSGDAFNADLTKIESEETEEA